MTQIAPRSIDSVGRALTEAQTIAAEMLGYCYDRALVLKEAKVTRASLWNWQQIPEFQEAVQEANRQYIAELREAKNRVVQVALDVVEEELRNKASKNRVDLAHSIVKSIL